MRISAGRIGRWEGIVVQKSVGSLLDALGITVDLDNGELVSGAVVILEVIEDDGETSLQIIEGEGTSWVHTLGMLHAALQMASSNFGHKEDHGEDEDL
jgi:hypothetical protein